MEMFDMGFPTGLRDEYERVMSKLGSMTVRDGLACCSEAKRPTNDKYKLSDGSFIAFPYRLYLRDELLNFDGLSFNERLIYDCMFTRSCDGYIRENHLKNILFTDYPEWCMPYILELSSEYVMEITAFIYDSLKERDSEQFQLFCQNNPLQLKRAYQRMTSYWNEFYRADYYHFKDYVGYKLFRECLMPHTNIERL